MINNKKANLKISSKNKVLSICTLKLFLSYSFLTNVIIKTTQSAFKTRTISERSVYLLSVNASKEKKNNRFALEN